VLTLSKDTELQSKLTENGYNKVLAHFTKEVMAKKTIEIYEQVLTENDH